MKQQLSSLSFADLLVGQRKVKQTLDFILRFLAMA